MSLRVQETESFSLWGNSFLLCLIEVRDSAEEEMAGNLP